MGDTHRQQPGALLNRPADRGPSTLWRRHRALALSAVALALYALAFPPLFALRGPQVASLSTIPVLIVAWLLGMRAGVAAGLLLLPIHTALMNLVEPSGLDVVFRGGGAGSLALVIVGAVVGRLHDLTERVKAQSAALAAEQAQARREMEARQRAEERATRLGRILDASAHEIFVCDARSLRLVELNLAASRNLGYAAEEQPAPGLRDLAPDLAAAELERLLAPLQNGEQDEVTFETLLRRKDGSRYPVEVRAHLAGSEGGAALVCIAQDLTERWVYEEQLRQQALSDPITGLPNRAWFVERLEEALSAGAGHDLVAVLFLDLDRFKLVNDGLGYSMGDQLLFQVARRLRAGVRSDGIVARFGGDEFVLLERITGLEAAVALAERALEQFRAPFRLDGRTVFASASVGITLARAGRSRPGDALREADLALAQAKAAGRGRYVVFDPSMAASSAERLALESDLHHALERGEFELHYQPEVELASGRIVGVEALLRWQHPERGLVSPALFIPIAEESDLIVRIGRWVLAEACRQARAWHERCPNDPPLVVSVNLSGRQLHQPDVVAEVAAALRATGLEPSALKLEITESVLVSDGEPLVSRLRALRALGVRLAIDDFGTGYSSLQYLRTLPVDTLKIDRAFISDGDERNQAIVRAIVALAHALGLDVTAEGVETAEQCFRLQRYGCDRGQGFYFARPLPSAALERALARDGAGPDARARELVA